MRNWKKTAAILLSAVILVTAASCYSVQAGQSAVEASETAEAAMTSEASETAEAAMTSEAVEASETAESAKTSVTAETAEAAMTSEEAEESKAAQKNGEVYVLFTSDVHCGIDEGFGYAGLKEIRESLEAEGYETILVDDGDSIQGNAFGTMDRGETIIEFMNEMKYDIAIPGNHEFDYGADYFLELTKKADFPYISCNFVREDELVFQPYIIKEAAGKKIAFVGVTTPSTISTSLPASFQNEEGEFIYGFLQGSPGDDAYDCVQNAVDAARAEGADLVYVMGHLGMYDDGSSWTYADVISHTEGIDVFLDGHSHDTEQVVMKNRAGREVTRSAVGTRLERIGYSHISADGEVLKTGTWTWTNEESAPELFHFRNRISEMVEEAQQKLSGQMSLAVASTQVELTINDPEAVDSVGKPVRMVRRAETNLGDLVADAFREQAGAEIGIVNGGNVRSDLHAGSITYGDLYNVMPFEHNLAEIELTGQQILDMLEWGSRNVPGESGGFLQVSGLSYEIHTGIDSPCIDDGNSMFKSIEGGRRVQNVKVGEDPLDPEKKYTVASFDYTILDLGDGFTMLKDAAVLKDRVKLDIQVVIDYITDSLGGTVGEEYADPYGQGRIVIVE